MKVLVTGVGAIIGQGILKSLRQGGFEGKIHGMDIYSHAYGQVMCDKFHLAPRADSASYIEQVNSIIEENKIDLILPGIEQDLYRLHKEIGRVKCQVVMNADLLIELSKDKWATFNFFKKSGLNLIPTYDVCDFEFLKNKLGLPFILKPKFSYASKGLHLVEDENQFKALIFGKENSLIFQKRILPFEGEYTVHLFGDGEGAILDILAMKRQLSSDGSTGVAEFSNNKEVIEYCERIASLTKPKGPTNIQLMLENKQPLLLEINPRFSSACSIATIMGFNSPMHSIAYFLEKKEPRVLPKAAKKVVRYIEDWILPSEQQ